MDDPPHNLLALYNDQKKITIHREQTNITCENVSKVMTTLSDMVMQCGGGGCCVLEQCFQYPRRAREPRDCGCQFALLHRADIAWPSVLANNFFFISLFLLILHPFVLTIIVSSTERKLTFVLFLSILSRFCTVFLTMCLLFLFLIYMSHRVFSFMWPLWLVFSL